jgi:hypothetical protein
MAFRLALSSKGETGTLADWLALSNLIYCHSSQLHVGRQTDMNVTWFITSSIQSLQPLAACFFWLTRGKKAA